MNRKNLPVIIMLVAGAIASITAFIKNWGISQKLFVLLLTLVVFYGLGVLLEKTLDYFDTVNERRQWEEEKQVQAMNEELESTIKEVAEDIKK